jgi:hypothetical protein
MIIQAHRLTVQARTTTGLIIHHLRLLVIGIGRLAPAQLTLVLVTGQAVGVVMTVLVTLAAAGLAAMTAGVIPVVAGLVATMDFKGGVA